MRIGLVSAGLTVDRARRTISGTLYRFGETGQTDAGPLTVRDSSSITIPANFADIGLTREHDETHIRGSLSLVDDSEERRYVVLKVADGPEGDTALEEAATRVRAGLSFLVRDAIVQDGVLISSTLSSIGQVAEPAFNSARIDRIAAAAAPTNPGETMTPEQIARLAALRAQQNLNPEEQGELSQLLALAADQVTAAEEVVPEDAPAADAPDANVTAQVAASMPVVPTGIPTPTTPRVQVRESALNKVIRQITDGLRSQQAGGSAIPAIAAAFTDITSTANTGNVEAVAWSGELWSGLEYEPVFTDLLTPDTLTNWEGKGWRFTTTPEMQDYAGDKGNVPSGTVVTEASEYEAARMAVGVDIDRKFYDFPNESFVSSLLERIRETWEIKLDAKVRAYIATQAVAATRTVAIATTNADATITFAAGMLTSEDIGAAITGTGIPAATTILSITNTTTAEMSANATATGTPTATVAVQSTNVLRTAARTAQTLRNTRVGRSPWIVVNDEDMFSLLNLTNDDLMPYLKLWGIEPENFRSSPDVAVGTVYGGVKQAGKLRTLPGSPIRVSAQHLAQGGVDEAFFGYWAIEEHHASGIVKATYKRA